jgi:hypothetical protein
MNEARITCACSNVIIADLGLRMTKGSVVYVSEAEARKSKDLMLVARAGGVIVNFVKRAQEIRQPTAVVGRPKREPFNPHGPRPIPIQPEPMTKVVDDIDALVMEVFQATSGIPDSPKARKKTKV